MSCIPSHAGGLQQSYTDVKKESSVFGIQRMQVWEKRQHVGVCAVSPSLVSASVAGDICRHQPTLAEKEKVCETLLKGEREEAPQFAYVYEELIQCELSHWFNDILFAPPPPLSVPSQTDTEEKDGKRYDKADKNE